MTSKGELKGIVCQEIDNHRSEIIDIAKSIEANPETGFREAKTSLLVANKFKELGISYRDKLAITGVKGVVIGGDTGPTVAILGELDSLIIPDHPMADPVTGAAHACGHNAQIATMIATAIGLTNPRVLSLLTGRVAFIAVPAEEYIELEYRNNLRQEGKLSFLGGKSELIKLGEFDDINIAMLTHNTNRSDAKKLALGGTMNGTVAKQIQFLGRGAHAGAAPHEGINALNAAMVALSAIHAQRETFREDDTIRVHPIITKGGEAVNIVPADVRMETFVRGKTLEAIIDANEKVDRALRAGSLAIGAKVQIATLPGYLPLINNPTLQEIHWNNAISLVGEGDVTRRGHITASSDMGDVSHIMPVIQPLAGGATGTSHGNDYKISDYDVGVLLAAKAMALDTIDLLYNGATKAKEIITTSKPAMTKQEYLNFMASLLKVEEFME